MIFGKRLKIEKRTPPKNPGETLCPRPFKKKRILMQQAPF
jgi:hypothetical protein